MAAEGCVGRKAGCAGVLKGMQLVEAGMCVYVYVLVWSKRCVVWGTRGGATDTQHMDISQHTEA